MQKPVESLWALRAGFRPQVASRQSAQKLWRKIACKFKVMDMFSTFAQALRRLLEREKEPSLFVLSREARGASEGGRQEVRGEVDGGLSGE